MKKKYAGYINLNTLNGVLYPSSIQNTIMKNYIEINLDGIFYLSPTEILQAKYPITLNTLISKETNVSGIVMLSTFFLPNNYNQRLSIYKKLFLAKKKMYFILDELFIENKKDISNVEDFIIFNCEHFTSTKKRLNEYETAFMKNFSKVSLV